MKYANDRLNIRTDACELNCMLVTELQGGPKTGATLHFPEYLENYKNN